MNARARRERAVVRCRRRWGPIGNVRMIQQYREVNWGRLGQTLGGALHRAQVGGPLVPPITRRGTR